MRKHPKRLSEAGISPARLGEMKNICRQYRAMKRALENARHGVVDRRRGRSGIWHKPDPTGNAAINIAAMPEARRVRLIEQSADAVAEPVVAAAILKSVTEDVKYEKLRPRPPIGRNQFYVTVLLFYIELDARLYFDEPDGHSRGEIGDKVGAKL